MTARELEAIFLLVGTIVGVGMFAIPFTFAAAGFLLGVFELIILSGAVLAIHLAYGRVVLGTPEHHLLPGYAHYYFGPVWGWLSQSSYVIGLSGALLIYVVVGGGFLGSFLHSVLPVFPEFLGPGFFYILGALVVSRGIRLEGISNAILTLGMLGVIMVMALTLFPAGSLAELGTFHWPKFFLPYGVLLFALSGSAVIPEVKRFLGKETSLLRQVIICGTLTAALLYFVFALVVVGATGLFTTRDAISGLGARFGLFYLMAGSLIGFLAAITSFIGLGAVYKDMLALDFGLRPMLAWGISVLVPGILYIAGLKDFIVILGLVGSISIGFDSLLILLLDKKISAAPGSAGKKFPSWLRVILLGVLGLGMVWEIVAVLLQ